MARKKEGEAAGRMPMIFAAEPECSITEPEYDQQSPSTVLAENCTGLGGGFGNSYVVGHGSYPHCERHTMMGSVDRSRALSFHALT